MLDEIFISLKGLDNRLETFVNEPVAAFGEQLAGLFKNVPVPAAGDELKKAEDEIRAIKSDPKSLQKRVLLATDKPIANPAIERLNLLYDERRRLIEAFLKDEKIRSFKKNLVYLLERVQDIILRSDPEHRDIKIRYVDSALRQVEISCTPAGLKEPVVEHVEGVSRQMADKGMVDTMPALQAEFQLKLMEHSNGKRTGEIVKAGE